MRQRLPSFTDLKADVERARAAMRHGARPSRVEAPGPGEESVWDYPRPPRVEQVPARLRVVFAGLTLADTTRGLRVLETAGAPVYYFPPEDVDPARLEPAAGASLCEWKGVAIYWDVVAEGRRAARAAWSYPEPFTDLGQGYERLRDHLAFYAAPMDACYVGDEEARPQPGGFYGGWVTAAIRGPIKGEPGSGGW